jgi:hypothetical protein
MLVTLLGISTEVKPVHDLKRPIPIYPTPFGIVIEVRLLQPQKVCVMLKSATLFGISMAARLVQSSNANTPNLVTLFGISIEVRLVQPLKAEPPILVTPSSIITFSMD